MNVVLRALVTLLCGVGLYTALFMLRKTVLAQRGELREASVVQTPRARLYGGVSNALIGACYYPAMVAAVWLPPSRALAIAAVAAAAFAAVTSVVLAYSLLFVTRRSCPYCWTAHAINWSLLGVALALFKINILN